MLNKGMKTILFLVSLPLMISNSLAKGPTISSCKPHFKEKVKSTHQQLLEDFQVLSQNQESIYKNLIEIYQAPASNRHRKKFFSTLECIQRKIQQGSYNYKCAYGKLCSDYKAYIRKMDKPLNHFLQLGSIKICSNQFIFSSKDYLAATIVHEASHLCLTKDHSYFTGLDREEMRASNWVSNADSYRNIYYYKDLLY